MEKKGDLTVKTTLGKWAETDLGVHRCWCFEPAEPSVHGNVVIYLHSSCGERLAERAAIIKPLAAQGLRVLCPMARESWWVDRVVPSFDDSLTPERFLVDHVVTFAKQARKAAPLQIALLGVGMGGQGALRLAYKHPSLFPVVAAIAPSLDFHFRLRDGDTVLQQIYRDTEQARQDTATLHIHPLNWPRHQWYCCDPNDYDCWEGGDRLRMKLSSIGIPFECDLETTVAEERGNDRNTYVDLMAEKSVAFLSERLERERLRI